MYNFVRNNRSKKKKINKWMNKIFYNWKIFYNNILHIYTYMKIYHITSNLSVLCRYINIVSKNDLFKNITLH